ncbi:S-adenosyl-L-methionine-dependent methyltransferase [Chlamydoabsidia padenii]|nr:S-adenosyl-L-methionine-dependent methyltransferase [Chlamydoabsidia padenii]
MGSSHSKRTKDTSSTYSHRQTIGNLGSPTPTSSSQHSLRHKYSFNRSYSNTVDSVPSRQQQQGQKNAALTRPPIFTGIQSNSFFLPRNWQAEDADHGLHFALKQLFASNVLSLVLPKLVQGALIIELGCGHGSWILDMATQFPESQFIGFDTSLDRLPEGLPPLGNVNLQVTSIGKDPIPLANRSVDVIHLRARNIFMDHDQWRFLLEESHRVLKPGGMIHIVDYLRRIMTTMNRDTDRAAKLGPQLQDFGFQVLQSLSKKVHYGSGGKLGEAFTAVILHRYDELSTVLAPAMGLSLDDYRHRVEMVVAQCVNANSFLTWYAYAARKVS